MTAPCALLEPVSIERVIELLEQEHGALRRQPHDEPVDVLIRTILSQNTSDTNSDRAFDSLKAGFDGWEGVASAPVEFIARAIQSGGLFRIKAARIKQILEQIEEEQGRISLESLGSMSAAEAESYLMSLPGVGYKTARCVLLFSLGRASLPVDTHILRVSKRLGLIDSRASMDRAHALLEEQVPASKVYGFHVHMIEHGRKTCRARRPLCNRCVLRVACPGSSLT